MPIPFPPFSRPLPASLFLSLPLFPFPRRKTISYAGELRDISLEWRISAKMWVLFYGENWGELTFH